MTPTAPIALPVPTPAPALALVSQSLGSHCTVTVKTGTNIAPGLRRQDVKTTFSLRYEGAYPLQIKGLKDEGEFVGFELSVSGPDECEQLIRALEHAASELRWQAGQPAEVLSPADYTPENERGLAQAVFFDAELDLLYLLLFQGSEPIAGGPTVARYLRSQVQQQPPVATIEAWGRVLSAMDQDLSPTLDWLEGLGQDVDLVELLRPLDPGPRPEGYTLDARALRHRCEQAVAYYYRAGLRVEELDLLDAVGQEADADKRLGLLRQLRAVEARRTALNGALS